MATIISEVCQEQGLLMTVSDGKDGKYDWRLGCAITGAFMKGGEGCDSTEDALAKVKAAKRAASI